MTTSTVEIREGNTTTNRGREGDFLPLSCTPTTHQLLTRSPFRRQRRSTGFSLNGEIRGKYLKTGNHRNGIIDKKCECMRQRESREGRHSRSAEENIDRQQSNGSELAETPRQMLFESEERRNPLNLAARRKHSRVMCSTNQQYSLVRLYIQARPLVRPCVDIYTWIHIHIYVETYRCLYGTWYTRVVTTPTTMMTMIRE